MSFHDDDLIGSEIANGRYKILGRVGQGSMGQVFLAHDRHLQTDIVLKFPFAADKSSSEPEFLDRFAKEIRSLVELSHPHIVKVFDVGEHESRPFVAMQFLAGGSLKDRIACGPAEETVPMPPQSLKDWLLEIAEALDFIHARKHIHRDVKPANILFDRYGHPFLGDFGIIKALTSEQADWRENSLTAPGFLIGTPNYVAPEIVMGRPFDGRVDQYSLAMTVHEALSGTNCMAGPTPSATVVNQTIVVPPALTELIPAISGRLSSALSRGLAKEPGERFASCAEFAREILAAVPSSATTDFGSSATTKTIRGQPGQVACPACQAPMPVGREHAGGSVRCTACQATSLVSLLSSNTVQLKLVNDSFSTTHVPSAIVVESPDDEAETDPLAATAVVERVKARPSSPKKLALKKWAIATAAVLGIGLVALLLMALVRPYGSTAPVPGDSSLSTMQPAPADAAARLALKPASPPVADDIELNLAYGTEKQKWLEEALREFQGLPSGKRIKVNLHGMGSMEGARAVIDGPGTAPIHVWSPASSAYRDAFERDWRTRHHNDPILKSENLALTPMVFVMWESRQQEHNLSHDDIAQPEFQRWMGNFEKAVARPGGSLTASTGTLMREMVLRGPSQYDCLLIYENLAIDYLEAARDRWGELHVDYPEPNIWNEHPYYILDVPWSDSRQREAAGEFLKFLMSEPIQKRALEHGFRPGNPSVSVRFPESPLIRHARQGLKIDLPRMCEPPTDQVMRGLLSSFQRIEK